MPSELEREVLSSADLERRLELLRSCWAEFDDVSGGADELRPGARSAGRTRAQIIRHVYANEPDQYSRKVEVRTPIEGLAASLFGRHICRRTQHSSFVGQGCQSWRIMIDASGDRPHSFGKTKIKHLCVTSGSNQNI